MNKTALVTGASQGLGLCLCQALLKREYFVTALDIRLSGELKSLEGRSLQAIECDISDDDAVAAAGKVCLAKSLDILFNNAGIWLEKERRSLLDPQFSFDNMIAQYQINAVGALRVARTFLPRLLAGQGKVMVNISSEAGSIENCLRIVKVKC